MKKDILIEFMKLIISTLLIAIFIILIISNIKTASRLNGLHNDFMTTEEFRVQYYSDDFVENLTDLSNRDDMINQISIYILDYDLWSIEQQSICLDDELLEQRIDFWSRSSGWSAYKQSVEAIWKDIQYFPVPASTMDDEEISFQDSWGSERSYGGPRTHEGTDLMPSKDIAGYYPVVSMTDGVVTNIGWLENGGYRVGITSPSGGYYYYAHLDSYANIQKGDTVIAGQLLGYMGDTGYGEEGTTGQFAVHLHIGIYIYIDNEEISVNPYSILKYLESYKLKYQY